MANEKQRLPGAIQSRAETIARLGAFGIVLAAGPPFAILQSLWDGGQPPEANAAARWICAAILAFFVWWTALRPWATLRRVVTESARRRRVLGALLLAAAPYGPVLAISLAILGWNTGSGWLLAVQLLVVWGIWEWIDRRTEPRIRRIVMTHVYPEHREPPQRPPARPAADGGRTASDAERTAELAVAP